MSKIYFGGLNELRAIAALGVVFHHIEQLKGMEGIPLISPKLMYFIQSLGKEGVHLFFVLSGFLITYLLFLEKEKNLKINISKFYFRRIFRIWPLYYFIMFISFVIIPLLANFSLYENSPGILSFVNNPANYNMKTTLLYLFFLPQFGNIVLGAAQSWSIGVEEQFYLIIPLLFSLFNRKWFFYFLSLVMITYFITAILMHEYYGIENIIFKIFKYFKIQYLTIGAIGGYLYFFNQKKIVDLTKNKYSYILILISIITLMSIKIFDFKFQDFILGVLYIFLILFSINNLNKFVFRNRVFSYFGKISYGIYMYHLFMIFLILPFVNKYFLNDGGNYEYYNLILYSLIYFFTIITSILSYEFFESKFINYKNKKYKV